MAVSNAGFTGCIALFRHAKAADALPGQDDGDRPLNKEGEDQAFSRYCAEPAVSPDYDLVLSSPAKRAEMTIVSIAAVQPTEVVKLKALFV
jgi:phosphohistidine phosphatase SixA